MITWLFDRRNQWGYLPNLIKDETLKPGSQEWWDLCIQKPFSYEFRFLRYCQIDKVEQHCSLVSGDWSTPAYYPVNLNFWDTEVDYFSYMDPESLQLLKQGSIKILFYYSEGDDIDVEIDAHLRSMCNHHGIDINNVRVAIANWLIDGKDPYIYFPDDELYYRYLHLMKNNHIKDVNLAPRSKYYTCLIRADKVWRKVFASQLYKTGLCDYGYFSYNNYKYETPYTEEDSLDNWESLSELLAEDVATFDLHTPWRADDLSDSEHNNHSLVHRPHYEDSYWNVVVETHFQQNTCFLTEKTFKPILNLQPFIIVGTPKSLQLLAHLGYQTFGDIIDESYDELLDHESRIQDLIMVVYSICQRQTLDHIHMINAVSDRLRYNQKHFIQPKTQRIKNFLSKLEY